ncbi:MAG TPA: hypothetical protein PKD64_19030 [Pirellulaceae bacterium]|nr:hypothetical protein [Pirellulaceae bacterium]HMP70813.1 hypothetical protein [Pirellulaceae bacterium]
MAAWSDQIVAATDMITVVMAVGMATTMIVVAATACTVGAAYANVVGALVGDAIAVVVKAITIADATAGIKADTKYTKMADKGMDISTRHMKLLQPKVRPPIA